MGGGIYIQPEVNWLTQGSIFKSGADLSDPFNQEVKLKTIQIPLLIGAKVINFKKVNFRVFGGPTASIVSSKTIENKVADYIAPLKDADNEDNIGVHFLILFQEMKHSDICFEHLHLDFVMMYHL